MQTEEWTNMMKLMVAFHNFANTPKNGCQHHLIMLLLYYLAIYLSLVFVLCKDNSKMNQDHLAHCTVLNPRNYV